MNKIKMKFRKWQILAIQHLVPNWLLFRRGRKAAAEGSESHGMILRVHDLQEKLHGGSGLTIAENAELKRFWRVLDEVLKSEGFEINEK